MPQDDIAAQWKSFDPERRDRLLKKMSPEQKKKLRGMLETKHGTPANPNHIPAGAPRAEVSSPRSLMRSAALGAFEGAGIKPGATAGEVIGGTLEQAGQGIRDLLGRSYQQTAAVTSDPVGRVAGTIIGLPATFIEGAADSLEQGGRQTIQDIRNKDYEAAAEHGTAALTTAALLRSGREKPVEADAGLSTVGKLRQSTKGFARKVTGVEPAVKDAVTKAAEQHEGAVTSNEAQKQAGVERAGQAKAVDEHSVKVREHLEKVEGSVAKEANAKFDRVREKIGNPETSAGPLVETVKGVEANVLQNIPENIKEFRAILKLEPLPEHIADAVRAHVGFEPEGTEPLTWDKLQSLKSRLDARLRSRSAMNGDLKRALYQTRDAVVDEMGKMADVNGAQGEWQDARDFWRKYKEDFHEASGPSGSASPVAQSLNAIDPANIRQPFLRTQSAIGNRGTEILRRWPQHGGTEAATAVENMVSEHGKLKYMPDKNPNPPAPTPPTVDISKVAKGAIAQRAKSWGAFNARDVGIIASSAIAEPIAKLLGLGGGGGSVLPVAVGAYEGGKFAAARALNNPAVIDWLAKTPPEEAAALQKIPGADKIRIVDGLTKAAVQSGKPVPLSTAARTLLGPANVARIVAATAAGSQVKNRRDARELLGQPSN